MLCLLIFFSYLKICQELQQSGTLSEIAKLSHTAMAAQPVLHSIVVMKFLLRNINYKRSKDFFHIFLLY